MAISSFSKSLALAIPLTLLSVNVPAQDDDPLEIKSQDLAAKHYTRAVIKELAFKHHEALKSYQTASVLVPEKAEYLAGYARTSEDTGDLVLARKLYCRLKNYEKSTTENTELINDALKKCQELSDQ